MITADSAENFSYISPVVVGRVSPDHHVRPPANVETQPRHKRDNHGGSQVQSSYQLQEKQNKTPE